MLMSLEATISLVEDTILAMLNKERVEEGILADVEEIYIGEKANRFDFPAIWILDERLEPETKSLGPNSIEEDTAVYQFYALNYDSDNPEDSYKLCKKLATKIGDALEKHCLIKDSENNRVFDSVSFLSLEPTPTPSGAANAITQAVIRYEFRFTRQRNYCTNSQINNEN